MSHLAEAENEHLCRAIESADENNCTFKNQSHAFWCERTEYSCLALVYYVRIKYGRFYQKDHNFSWGLGDTGPDWEKLTINEQFTTRIMLLELFRIYDGLPLDEEESDEKKDNQPKRVVCTEVMDD